MKLVRLDHIFDVEYGNQLDLNKLLLSSLPNDKYINFISRTARNNGVVGKVLPYNKIEPYPAGLMTVALGGTVLSVFVQPDPFYTAQNIKVLNPKYDMPLEEKLYYCAAIRHNRFRYTSHGREANKTLDGLLVPSREDIPKWVRNTPLLKTPFTKTVSNKKLLLQDRKWQPFKIDQYFDICSSNDPLINELEDGNTTPYIASTEFNNGVVQYSSLKASNKGNVLTVNRGGSVGHTFYQKDDFLCTPVDVRILKPLFSFNVYLGMFLATIITNERYRFNYSRKMGTDRLKELHIKLPSDKHGHPDWQFMEDYIKSLPYSKNLESIE